MVPELSKFTLHILGIEIKSKKKAICIIYGIFEYKNDVLTETTTAVRKDFYFLKFGPRLPNTDLCSRL